MAENISFNLRFHTPACIISRLINPLNPIRGIPLHSPPSMTIHFPRSIRDSPRRTIRPDITYYGKVRISTRQTSYSKRERCYILDDNRIRYTQPYCFCRLDCHCETLCGKQSAGIYRPNCYCCTTYLQSFNRYLRKVPFQLNHSRIICPCHVDECIVIRIVKVIRYIQWHRRIPNLQRLVTDYTICRRGSVFHNSDEDGLRGVQAIGICCFDRHGCTAFTYSCNRY